MPVEVTTDRAPVYPRALDELIPTAVHDTEQYANNSVEARSWSAQSPAPTDAWPQDVPSAWILAVGHAFVQNVRRGHYEIATDSPVHHRIQVVFDELTLAI